MNSQLIKLSLFWIILFSPSILFSQDYYNLGTKALMNKNYVAADSLLTLSIFNFETSDALINRAAARVYLSDTLSACDDLYMMAFIYLDEKAIELYHNVCCTDVYTIYYDKRFEISDESNFKYYTIVRHSKYDSISFGTFHKKGAKFNVMSIEKWSNKISILSEISTDIIGRYYLKNNRRIYTKTAYEIPIVSNETELNRYRSRAKIFLNAKYGDLKKDLNVDEIEILVKFIVNTAGEIEDVRYSNTYPELDLDAQQNEFENDVINMIYSLPMMKPAKLVNTKVDFEVIFKVIF